MGDSNPLHRVLYIDLANKRHRVAERPDLFASAIGGVGVASRILLEECPQGCDPLGADNPIVLAVGPLTGLFPMASKTVALFKSPHTGELGESHCGGRSAVAIRMAGYGAIVIKGSSDLPLYLAIHGDRVFFRDASTLWGMSSTGTVGHVIREREPGAGMRSIMRIGRAGEAGVSYAGVTTETYRHFGRLGLGAVFGSKKLKAIVVSGKRSLPAADLAEYRRLYDEIFQAAVSSPAMKKYHDVGTAQNVLPLDGIGALPTRNLRTGKFDAASRISGEAFAASYLGRRLACAHCPVACIHIAALREQHEKEPYFYKTSMISYDYEPIYAMGSMLGVADPEAVLRLLDRVEALGLDAMSAGVVLAWATEALERGLISKQETLDLDLTWGNWRAYLDALPLIVEQPNEFYAALARGVEHAAGQYGGAEFALASGKNEMPGYHTGPAAHIGCLIGARHSHLDNAGYGLDQKLLGKQPMSPEELTAALLKEERWRQVLAGLVVCFFAREIYHEETVVRALRVAGLDVDAARLAEIGKAVHRAKYEFKLREGFSFDALRVPARLTETPAALPGLTAEYVQRVIACAKSEIEGPA